MKKVMFILVLIIVFLLNSSSVIYAHAEDLVFYEAFEHHGSVMIISDSQTGEILHSNKAASDFYGYEIEQLETMKIQDLNDLTPDETKKKMQEIRDEKRHEFIIDHRLANGEIRTVEIKSYPYVSGNKTLLIGIVNDVTEKNQLEEKEEMLTNALLGMIILLMVISFLVIRNSRKLKAKNHEMNNFSELQRTFIDADNSLIYLKDENAKYVFINKAVEKFYNKESSKIIGYDDFDLTVKEFAALRRKTDLDVIEKKTIVFDEVKWENRIFQTTKFPVKLINGHYGVGAYVKDVTEEYNNKVELEKSNSLVQINEENLRLLLDSTAEAIYGIDTNGNCTFCNASCLSLLGYRHQDELLGKNMHWQIHYKRLDGTVLPLEECQVFKAFIKGEGTHVEGEVFWKADGTCFPAEYYSYPQYRNGEVVGAVITFIDITERKLAQDEILNANEQLENVNKQLQEKQYTLEEQNAVIEELNSQLEDENERNQQQKEILQAIIDSLGAGIVMLDAEGKITFINEAWKDLFNYLSFDNGHYSNSNFYINNNSSFGTELFIKNMLSGMENNDEIFTELSKLTKDRDKRYAVDMEQLSPVKRFLNLYSNPCVSQAGHTFGRVFVIRDVSHQKEVDRLKLELISTVSHELRTPMSSILGFSELLLTRKLSEDRNKEYLSIINSEATRLTNLINDFLDIQRMESGKQLFNKQFNSMPQIIEEAVKMFEKVGNEHSIICKNSKKDMPQVYCDRDKMLQVLSNLLSNAIKYSPAGGKIYVDFAEENSRVKVSVIDHGLGVPEDVKDKLFTKFFRVDNDDRRKIGGSGLGLAICKEIIRAHKGEIGVDSTYGQGSTFYFCLPLLNSKISNVYADNKVYNDSCTANNGQLLIVEDDAAMVKLIKEILKDERLEMHSTSSGEEAMRLVKEYNYRLFILDIALIGQLNGWDVVKELKSNCSTADTPIIISSAYENKINPSYTDISDYLVKPFEPELMVKVVRKALNGNLNSKMMLNSDEKLKEEILCTLNSKGISIKNIEHSGKMLIITLDGEEGLINE